MAERKSQHVVPDGDFWVVKWAGSEKASSVHRTKDEAIKAGRKTAARTKSNLVIHGRDGQIKSRSSK